MPWSLRCVREYNIRNGYTVPFRYTPKNTSAVLRRPGWLFSVIMRYWMSGGMPTRANYPDGIIVSNHGGRNFDSSMAPIEVLAPIVDAVGQRTTVIIDSGFRRGSDVVKALALGAKLVMVGRATP